MHARLEANGAQHGMQHRCTHDSRPMVPNMVCNTDARTTRGLCPTWYATQMHARLEANGAQHGMQHRCTHDSRPMVPNMVCNTDELLLVKAILLSLPTWCYPFVNVHD